MQKRSILWLLPIAVSTVCLSCGAVYGASYSFPSGDGKAAGQDSGNLAIGTYGTKEKVNQNINAPMMQTGSMTTVDGAKSFNSAFSSPSSSKFLLVAIEPSGAGDLSKVTIAQDLDKDGLIDSNYALTVPISGVCANGFISCTPGTWSNCSAYKWISDSSGAVSEAPGSLTKLGGCYCINSSCGSNLAWTNSAIILDGIGGGIVSAIHDNDPSLMITSVQKDLTTITYFGSAPTKTVTASTKIPSLTSSPQITDLTAYYGNPTGLTNMRDGMAISQSSDPNSLFSLITGVGSKAASKTGSCSITRAGSIKTTSESVSNTGKMSFDTDHNEYIRINEKIPGKTYDLMIAGSSSAGSGPTGWTVVNSVTLPAAPTTKTKLTTALYVSTTSGDGCVTGTATIDGMITGFNNTINHPGYCPKSGWQKPDNVWSALFEYSRDDYSEVMIDTCSAYASDLSCRIKDESINGVVTIRDYNPTGLKYLGSCVDFNGATEVMQVCREWWEKKREYVCNNGGAYDFSDVSKRFGNVINSTTAGAGGFSFSDTTKGKDGSWVDKASSGITLPANPNVPTCEPACKTRKSSTDTQISVSGPVGAMRKDGADTYSYAYRPCINNSCPAEPGEEILLDCQCINEFAQAAVIIQTLRLSGNDNICSSGSKKPMKP